MRPAPSRPVAFANSLPGIILFNVAAALVPFLSWGNVRPSRSVRAAGAAVFAAGWILGLVSLRRLGSNYSRPVLIKPDHELVTDGPYSRVRHPLYTASFVIYFGLCLAMGSVLGLVFGMVVVVPRFMSVADYEEELLEDEFQGEYRDWVSRTGKFLPRLPHRGRRS